MIPYAICLAIIILFFIILTTEIVRQYKIIHNAWLRISICVILTILCKLSFSYIFCGLEYEDSYVFSFCAKQFNQGIYSSRFLIDAISVGSLETPFETCTYGGHFITYSVYLSIFTKLFGWSFSVISLANSIITFYILLILSSFKKEFTWNWLVGPIIYCIAPIINVFSNTFLAETFSSLVCLTFILSYWYFRESKSPVQHALVYISFFLAIITKRENIVLLIIPCIRALDLFIRSLQERKVIQGNSFTKVLKLSLAEILPFICLTVIYLVFIHNIFSTETTEAIDIESSTFSLTFFVKLFPCFIEALFTFSYFSISFWLFVILCMTQFSRKFYSEKIVSIIVLFVLYLGLYTFHYRGYFFVMYDELSSFESFRYLNNFYYLIPLCFCHTNLYKRSLLPILIVFLGVALWQTKMEREYYSQIENEERFEKAKAVEEYINSINDKAVLVTENILIYQNVVNKDFNLCNIGSLRTLPDFVNSRDIRRIFIDVSNIGYLKDRYNIDIISDECKRIHVTSQNQTFEIYEVALSNIIPY